MSNPATVPYEQTLSYAYGKSETEKLKLEQELAALRARLETAETAIKALLPYAIEAMAKSEYPCPAGVAVLDAEEAIAKATPPSEGGGETA